MMATPSTMISVDPARISFFRSAMIVSAALLARISAFWPPIVPPTNTASRVLRPRNATTTKLTKISIASVMTNAAPE